MNHTFLLVLLVNEQKLVLRLMSYCLWSNLSVQFANQRLATYETSENKDALSRGSLPKFWWMLATSWFDDWFDVFCLASCNGNCFNSFRVFSVRQLEPQVYTHITPVLRNLLWLPVREGAIFKIMLLAFKELNSLSPCNIKQAIDGYWPHKCLRFTND